MPSPTCLCGSCPKCYKREYMRRWRAANPERWKELVAASYQRHAAKRRRGRFEYREANRETVLAKDREYTRTRRPKGNRDPAKDKARMAVFVAIQKGELTPQPCEKCGDNPVAHDGRRAVHAHHDDYNNPLEVRWLCYPCHGREHRLYAAEEQ